MFFLTILITSTKIRGLKKDHSTLGSEIFGQFWEAISSGRRTPFVPKSIFILLLPLLFRLDACSSKGLGRWNCIEVFFPPFHGSSSTTDIIFINIHYRINLTKKKISNFLEKSREISSTKSKLLKIIFITCQKGCIHFLFSYYWLGIFFGTRLQFVSHI